MKMSLFFVYLFQAKQAKQFDHQIIDPVTIPQPVQNKKLEIIIDLTLDSDDDTMHDEIEMRINKNKTSTSRTNSTHSNGLSNLRFANNEFVYIID